MSGPYFTALINGLEVLYSSLSTVETDKSSQLSADFLSSKFEEKMLRKKMLGKKMLGNPIDCALCGIEMKTIQDTHNPYPLTENEKDRCCSKCNFEKVIPARFLLASLKKEAA